MDLVEAFIPIHDAFEIIVTITAFLVAFLVFYAYSKQKTNFLLYIGTAFTLIALSALVTPLGTSWGISRALTTLLEDMLQLWAIVAIISALFAPKTVFIRLGAIFALGVGIFLGTLFVATPHPIEAVWPIGGGDYALENLEDLFIELPLNILLAYWYVKSYLKTLDKSKLFIALGMLSLALVPATSALGKGLFGYPRNIFWVICHLFKITANIFFLAFFYYIFKVTSVKR